MSSNLKIKVIFFDLGDTLVNRNSPEWISGAQEVLQELSHLGLLLGIISNTGSLSRQELIRLLPNNFSWDIFHPDLIVLSSETNPPLVKPDPKIFELAIGKAEEVINAGECNSFQSRECLFCGESLEETLVAQQTGMFSARVLEHPISSDIGKLINALSLGSLIG